MIWRLVICSNLALFAASVSGRVEAPQGDPAVVWFEPVAGDNAPGTAAAKKTIDQKNKTFLPHIVAIQSGGSIAFPNHDPFFHNAFSNYSGQPFDTGLYAPGTSKVITFRRPGVARVFCNIHPTMSAVIVVVETPYHAVTNKDGAFVIADVPAGEYTMRVFTERASDAELEGLTRKLTIGDATTIPPIRISGSGFIPPPPHKNKFGKEYPAVIVDQYPGKP
jgi:plastocyanin